LQGFHDIVVTFLLVVGEDLTFAIMNKLCQNHLRYAKLHSGSTHRLHINLSVL